MARSRCRMALFGANSSTPTKVLDKCKSISLKQKPMKLKICSGYGVNVGHGVGFRRCNMATNNTFMLIYPEMLNLVQRG